LMIISNKKIFVHGCSTLHMNENGRGEIA
jgi:hypothetical protein